MQIGKIFYPISTLGPGKRACIWTIGCTRNCDGCSNPDLQLFDKSKDVNVTEIVELIKKFDCNGVTITGGEPFLQIDELKELVVLLNDIGIDDILVYTGYKLDELIKMSNHNVEFILANISVLIDGPFIKELVDDVPLRGSSNQKIWLFKEKYEKSYLDCLNTDKKVDIIHLKGETHFIGIPFRDYKEVYSNYLKKGK